MKVDPDGGEQDVLATATLSVVLMAHDSALTAMLMVKASLKAAGQLMSGTWLSVMVTGKLHAAEFPEGSVAVHRMVVLPKEKRVVPIGGVHAMMETDPLLSMAVGDDHDTIPVARPLLVAPEIVDGHVRDGAVVSCTKILKVH